MSVHLSDREKVLLGEVADMILGAERLQDRPTCCDGGHIVAGIDEHLEINGGFLTVEDEVSEEELNALKTKVSQLDHFEGAELLRSVKGVWQSWPDR